MARPTLTNPHASAVANTTGGAEPAQATLLMDTHVHLHQCHAPGTLLDHAAANFTAWLERAQLNSPLTGALMLVESAGEAQFDRLRSGTISPGNGWRITDADEDVSLLLERDGTTLSLTAGRQIVTGEKLEVLALGLAAAVPDGLSLDSALDHVREKGAIAVVPWGFGKWVGRRGRVLKEVLERRTDVYLADNAGRWRAMKNAPLIRQAQQAGAPVLAGSDPLPLDWEVDKPGRYVTAIHGAIDAGRPFDCLAQALTHHAGAISTIGRRDSLRRFAKTQWALRRQRVDA